MARIRFVLTLAAVLALSASKGGWAQEPAATEETAAQNYTLDCHMLIRDGEATHTDVQIPTITLHDGQVGNFFNLTERPFVVAVQSQQSSEGTVNQPVVQTFASGWKVAATIRPMNDDWVSVEATIEYLQEPEVDTQTVALDGDPATLQIPTQKIESVRLFRCAQLDQPLQLEVELGGRHAEFKFVVGRVEETEADEAEETRGVNFGGVTPRIIIQEEEEDLLF